MVNGEANGIWFFAAFALMGTICIVIWHIAILACYRLCQHGHNATIEYADDIQTSPHFRYPTIIAIYAFFFTLITDIIHVYIHLMESKSFSNPIEPKIAGLADSLYYIGTVIFYTLLVFRIHFVFNQSAQFKLSRFTLTILGVMIGISAVAAIWYIIIITFFFKSWTDWVRYGIPATYVLSANDFVLNVTLFCLFYAKLRALIKSFRKYASGNASIASTSKLFDIITKHSVLFGSAIITNQLFFAGVMVMAFTDLGQKNFTAGLLMIMTLRSIEMLVNVCALWLVLKMNVHAYICCCGSCHKCVHWIFQHKYHPLPEFSVNLMDSVKNSTTSKIAVTTSNQTHIPNKKATTGTITKWNTSCYNME
eukprot:220766_1